MPVNITDTGTPFPPFGPFYAGAQPPVTEAAPQGICPVNPPAGLPLPRRDGSNLPYRLLSPFCPAANLSGYSIICLGPSPAPGGCAVWPATFAKTGALRRTAGSLFCGNSSRRGCAAVRGVTRKAV